MPASKVDITLVAGAYDTAWGIYLLVDILFGVMGGDGIECRAGR